MNTENTFPTTADADGFFIESDSDNVMNIYTKLYENGNKVKKVTLSTGKVAIVRELLGEETKNITRFMDKDPERYQMAGITVATKVDDQLQPIEFYEKMKMRDFNKLLSMYQDLNF